MDHDGYNHPNFPKSQKPTQKIFSFPTSSRPNPELKIPKQSNTSFFSNVSQRNVSNHRNGPGNDQPQLLRIFPPSNSFSTPQRMPKREPTSPADFGEEFHPMTSPNVRLTEDDTRLNGQQKGCKALDSHIIAPSHRYLPTPSEIHRPRSRAVSQTPSLSQESELGDGDDDLSNFVNRMKEAKVVKSQLAEERVLSANLRSQLASTQVKVSELQHRNAGLEKAAGENQGHLQSKNEELSRTRQLLEEAEANQKSQENIISEKDRQLQCSAEQLALVRKRLHESDEKLATIRDAAKKRIEDLCKNFDSAQASFEQLKCRHDKSQQHLQLIRDEILDVKIAASDKLKGKSIHFSCYYMLID
ncbi:hypothetical protein VNI00_004889 [Paramarasmius palmivorus]|uniref:Uncharacterized protein n=1 Tax=Paramarasmius palmivorus TaxID=297713 RepID=A0AAW0DKL1_9AGAR